MSTLFYRCRNRIPENRKINNLITFFHNRKYAKHKKFQYHRTYRSRQIDPVGSTDSGNGHGFRSGFQDQILDTMDIERERGITIKSQTVCLPYTAKMARIYSLNLIDTPGHVDFTYEVSRALASCEGALLVIDASQGVEAQTLANLYLAMEHDLEIIPVINKIDLPSADIDRVKRQIEEDLGLDPEDSHSGIRQGRHRHRASSGGDCESVAAADRRSGSAAEGADF